MSTLSYCIELECHYAIHEKVLNPNIESQFLNPLDSNPHFFKFHVFFPKPSEMKFKRGDSVEISMNEEGFHGSYYVATVLSRLEDTEYLIEYTTLLDDGGRKLLRDIVDIGIIRPSPPEIRVSEFSLCDKVDVYDNDGWWVGVITGRKGLMYHVYFETTKEEIAYPQYRLRVHQDWEDGKWLLCHNGNR